MKTLENAPSIVRVLLTQCMQLAKYFSSGSIPEEEYKHYGLALPFYTHFTSPIRRYADQIVHRLIAACIEYDNLPLLLSTNEFIEKICK